VTSVHRTAPFAKTRHSTARLDDGEHDDALLRTGSAGISSDLSS